MNGGRPGVFSYFGYHLPFEDRIRLIAEAGFEATALWFGPEEGLVRRGDPNEMWRSCKEKGLAVDYVHASYRGCNAMWAGNQTDGRKLFDSYRRAADFCLTAGAGTLVIHAASGDAPPPSQAGVDFLAGLLEALRPSGVRLAVENTRTPEHLFHLLERLPGPGLCYDSSHDFLYGRPPFEILRRLAGRVLAVHLSDNDGRYDRHWLPGTGSGDIPAALVALDTAGFAGRLTLEVFPRDRRLPPAEFLKAARAWVDAALE